MNPRNGRLRHRLGTAILALGLIAGATTGVQVATQEDASAHTGDLIVTAVCNKQTGDYDFTSKLTLSQVPSGNTGSTKWRIGTSSFDGTPNNANGMDKGPIATTGSSSTVTLTGTQQQDFKFSLPGTTTGYGPWLYAYTKWLPDNYGKGSDGQLTTKLKGDCTQDTQPNPPGQDISCTTVYRDFGRALKNGDHINVTIERQNGSQYQVNVYVDLNIAGGYNTLGFRYSDGTTRPLTEAEVKKGHIWLDLSSKVSESHYKVQFVQINESENWPNLQCGTPKPDKPEPVVNPLTDDRSTCDSGVEHRTGTKITNWTFDENIWEWVKTTPVITWNNWTFVRDLTAVEKKDLNCAKPDKPEPITKPLEDDRKSCEGGVEHRTGNETTDWEFNENLWDWVKKAPVITWNNWTFVRDLTHAEKAEIDCSKPDKPEPKIEYRFTDWSAGCVTREATRDKQKRTESVVWNATDWKWDVSWGAWGTVDTETRDATAEECPVEVVPVIPDSPKAGVCNPETGGVTAPSFTAPVSTAEIKYDFSDATWVLTATPVGTGFFSSGTLPANWALQSNGTATYKVAKPADPECVKIVIAPKGAVTVECTGSGVAALDNSGSNTEFGFELVVNAKATLYSLAAGEVRDIEFSGVKPGSTVILQDGEANPLASATVPSECDKPTPPTPVPPVKSPPSASDSFLPNTGGPSALLAGLGISLFAAGSLLLLLARRRRRNG